MASSVIDEMQQRLQIFPSLAFGFLVVLPQQIGGMIGDHHRNIAPFVPFAARFRDAFFVIQQSLHGSCAQNANGSWLEWSSTGGKKLAANFHLVGQRRAIFRRPALHHVADVNVGAPDRDAFFGGGVLDHLRKKLTRAADKGQALLVFIGARTFAHENQR